MGENINYQKCRLCGADSNGAELCPRCDIRQAEADPQRIQEQLAGQLGQFSRVDTIPKLKPSLATAMVAAQQAAQGVAKAATNTHQRYRYASADAIIEEAREALSSAGLSFSVLKSLAVGDVLHTLFLLEHVSGEFRNIEYDCPIVEQSGRPRDRAVATARTYTLGYALRDLLLLPRVEEGADADQRDDRHHEPAPAQDPKKVAEIGAILEQRIGDAKTLKELAKVGVDASELPAGKVREYLKEKYNQRQTELRNGPGPAKAGPS